MTRIFSPSVSARPFRVALPARVLTGTCGEPVRIESTTLEGGPFTPRADAKPGDVVPMRISVALVARLESGEASPSSGWAALLEGGRYMLVTPEEAALVMKASEEYDAHMRLAQDAEEDALRARASAYARRASGDQM